MAVWFANEDGHDVSVRSFDSVVLLRRSIYDRDPSSVPLMDRFHSTVGTFLCSFLLGRFAKRRQRRDGNRFQMALLLLTVLLSGVGAVTAADSTDGRSVCFAFFAT